MNGAWVFVDLDGSLVHSLRRYPEMTGVPGYVGVDGAPIGVHPNSAAELLKLMAGAERVIPVTDRDVPALQRVVLPFTDVAICCRSGVILRPDGTRDPEWRAVMSDRLGPHQAALVELAKQLDTYPVRVRRVGDEGLDMYVAVRDLKRDAEHIAALDLGALAPPGWHVHQFHDQISFAPPPLTKGQAVDWLLRDGRPTVVVGLGDTHIDQDFLARCDFAMTPRGSQLASRW